jgi:hypothetical protein
MKAPVGAVAKEAGKQEARSAASPMMSVAAPPRPDLEVTLRTRDPGSAASEVEGIVRKVGAQAVERQVRDGHLTLSARIKTEHVDALLDKLKSLGSVQESAHAAPHPEGFLTIRIEFRPD